MHHGPRDVLCDKPRSVCCETSPPYLESRYDQQAVPMLIKLHSC